MFSFRTASAQRPAVKGGEVYQKIGSVGRQKILEELEKGGDRLSRGDWRDQARDGVGVQWSKICPGFWV